jgi:hypothetical protein
VRRRQNKKDEEDFALIEKKIQLEEKARNKKKVV